MVQLLESKDKKNILKVFRKKTYDLGGGKRAPFKMVRVMTLFASPGNHGSPTIMEQDSKNTERK